MAVIPNNYTIYINDPATHIAFKRAYDHNFFPVAMFGWRAGEGGSPTNGIPGIPLSPAVVESEILDGVKLRSLMLQMEDAESESALSYRELVLFLLIRLPASRSTNPHKPLQEHMEDAVIAELFCFTDLEILSLLFTALMRWRFSSS